MADPGVPQDKPHSRADHDFGSLAGHEHGEGEFDHDHDEDFLPAESRALESVSLVSMGLDIGSSGTQVAFTRLEMRGPGEHSALRRQARSRETLYLSPVALTPFVDAARIDEDRLWSIIDRCFRESGLTPDDVETGVIILTGAAARRDNAAAIAHRVAGEVGELVCAAAGDHMEAVLAAYGSGAVEASRAGAGRRLLAMDIGGATTKIALVDDGHILATAALDVGGRQIVVDREGRITRLEPDGARWAGEAGFGWQIGDVVSMADLAAVADAMAGALVLALSGSDAESRLAGHWITEPLEIQGPIEGIVVSGGVAEYVHLREKRDFGDLGWRLGWSLRRKFDAGAIAIPLLPPGECIRATVLGASSYCVQVSGATIYVSAHAELLPRRNLPVLQPAFDFRDDIDPDALAAVILAHRHQFDLATADAEFALALRWRGTPSYERLRSCAQGISRGLADRIKAGSALHLMLEGDAAQTLGAILHEEFAPSCAVLAIDGLALRDFDYVDIGRMRLPSHTVPVTVKSLIFGHGSQTSGAA